MSNDVRVDFTKPRLVFHSSVIFPALGEEFIDDVPAAGQALVLLLNARDRGRETSHADLAADGLQRHRGAGPDARSQTSFGRYRKPALRIDARDGSDDCCLRRSHARQNGMALRMRRLPERPQYAPSCGFPEWYYNVQSGICPALFEIVNPILIADAKGGPTWRRTDHRLAVAGRSRGGPSSKIHGSGALARSFPAVPEQDDHANEDKQHQKYGRSLLDQRPSGRKIRIAYHSAAAQVQSGRRRGSNEAKVEPTWWRPEHHLAIGCSPEPP